LHALGKSAATTIGGRLASAALKGAGAGAAYGFGEGEGGAMGRLESALKSGAVGAAAGPLMEAAVMGVGAAANRGLLGRSFRNHKGRAEWSKNLSDSASGKQVPDTNFGRFSNREMKRINDIPGLSEIARIENRNVIIPAERTAYIAGKRIAGDKIEPNDLAKLLNNALYGKKSQVTTGGNPFSVMMSSEKNPSGYGILLPNKNQSGTNVIDNVVQMDAERIPRRIERNNRILNGRDSPLSTTDSGFGSTLSARQSSDVGIMPPAGKDVKRAVHGRERLNQMAAEADRMGVPQLNKERVKN
jgi:hypothetical protein